jgi:hypothetical protein
MPIRAGTELADSTAARLPKHWAMNCVRKRIKEVDVKSPLGSNE